MICQYWPLDSHANRWTRRVPALIFLPLKALPVSPCYLEASLTHNRERSADLMAIIKSSPSSHLLPQLQMVCVSMRMWTRLPLQELQAKVNCEAKTWRHWYFAKQPDMSRLQDTWITSSMKACYVFNMYIFYVWKSVAIYFNC